MQRVEVIWEDAFGDVDEWVRTEDIASEPREVTTVGWEIKGANKRHYVIAGSHDPATGAWAHILHIPKGMVKKRTILK